ncbi:hypothetical protein NDN08_004474 [Rhodosorus marinus]|uniref:Uncharacterized protein n=1 Tax=Rhodosorus marinus TaxID=101924 RepID=A0AAV8ULG5_9RHOD|nr:hypothetical protein NDN08_004474 [Rhodosorus marinus]
MEENRGLGARSEGAEGSHAYSTPVKGHGSSSGGPGGAGHWPGGGQKFTVEDLDRLDGRELARLVMYAEEESSRLNALEMVEVSRAVNADKSRDLDQQRDERSQTDQEKQVNENS